MTSAPETLTDLVAAKLKSGGGRDTLDTLHPRCIDPSTGYAAGRSTVWKLSRPDLAKSVKIHPDLIRAVAAGLGLPADRVQRAAAYQYTGYLATDLGGGTVIHRHGMAADQMDKARSFLDRWDKEEQGGAGDD
jgi:hypothetical protein